MKEAQVQVLIGRWLINDFSNRTANAVAVETKLIKGTSFAFNRVADHQIDALEKVKRNGLYHKINDSAFNSSLSFTTKKPFDCFLMKGEAYIAAVWYVPRKKKIAYIIDIDDFTHARETCGRKSLTEQMCQDLSIETVDLSSRNKKLQGAQH